MTEETFPPWGVVTDDFWRQPSAAPTITVDGLPESYLPRIETINDDLAHGRTNSAALTAQQLDAQSTDEFGSAHPHTITLRELRGDLAHLAGDPATAAAWYLHTAGIRAAHWGIQNPLTRKSVERAHELWMDTPGEDALRLHKDLLGLLNGIAGPDAPSTQEATRRAQALAGTTSPRLGSTG